MTNWGIGYRCTCTAVYAHFSLSSPSSDPAAAAFLRAFFPLPRFSFCRSGRRVFPRLVIIVFPSEGKTRVSSGGGGGGVWMSTFKVPYIQAGRSEAKREDNADGTRVRTAFPRQSRTMGANAPHERFRYLTCHRSFAVPMMVFFRPTSHERT